MAFSLGPSKGFSEDAGDHRNPQMIGTHSLGLNKHYAPSWNQWHAFREFIQNWRDGILVAFDMDPTLFLPIWDETTPGVISITVHHEIKGRRELVGFIMHREGTGTVEIANFGADLSMDDLSIGGSTKRKCTKLAGAHSEGFKVGALVMVRAGFPVRIRSTCANWNFGFLGSKKDQFYCKISNSGEGHVDAEKRSWKEQTSWGERPRSDLVSYSFQDVTVQLSHPETGRDYRVPITAGEFRSWTTVSLDLNRPDPDKMIRTPHGDLIIDQRFAGQMYVKGLRVGSRTPGGRRYKHCYNFSTGKVCRNRERMMSYKEEAEALAKIWEIAMAEGNDNLVQRYIELFSEDCVDLISAEKASRIFAQRIWTWLRTIQPGAFYYSEASDSEHDGGHQLDFILNDLKKHPQRLAEDLWRLLAKYDCVRTPQQERALLFSSSRPVENVDGYFGQNMSRILESKPSVPPSRPSQFVSVETEAEIDESMETDPASDNEWSERDIYSATPQARHHQPVKESLDRETAAREEAISERVWQNEEFPQLRSIFLTPRTLCNCEEHLFRGGRKANERADIGDLLLHFSSVQHMGDQSDAEVVMIKDIAFAKALSTSFRVKYRPVGHAQSRVPLNVDGSSMTDKGAKEELSCRFARSASNETVTITPIIPKHLSPEERPKPKGFSSHAAVGVFDFTPNVLGPLEGFAEAGFNSFAGVGFDPEHSINWKMRYPNCPVFDGSAQQLFDDFGSGTLHHPELLAGNPIKVSLVAGENTDRCLKPRIDPELKESFLTPLNIMDSITQSNFDPDFRVLQMPPGVFHPNICEKFASTICQLLEKGETVRVNISSLQSFGCARQRLELQQYEEYRIFGRPGRSLQVRSSEATLGFRPSISATWLLKIQATPNTSPI
ncbi:hypothetical protein K4K51_007821 [Colletotrichum sp. SAR 10_75]|nr:hypothetical protein K4K51_007821 [Colletotrichum sp. SAR 10_75]